VTRILRLCFCLLLLVTACTTQRPDVEDERANQVASRIAERLHLADEARLANRLTTPEEDNAYLHYLTVLSIDPGNASAIDGINGIIEQYLSWALEVADEGRYRRARQYVARARAIDEQHPNIQPVLNMIGERENRITVSFDLDRMAVRSRQSGRLPLEKIARLIQRYGSFVTIRATDDASGRWLYQQLNDQVSFRIEARFVIDSVVVIELAH
jgi:hypothetical protein